MLRMIFNSLCLAGAILSTPALGAGLKIAVVAPAQGPFAPLGLQILEGARFQAQTRGSEMVEIAETCEAADAEDLRQALLSSGAEAAIGFLCTESLEAVLPALAERGVPALTLSVRSNILMEDALKKKWPFFRFVASAKAQAEKVADVILTRWKGKPLALIDDGTIQGRELVDAVRTALGAIGVTPVFSDTYRPSQEQQVNLVRRLVKSGATHVLVGGDRSDVAIIARDAKLEAAELTLMGGEALDAPDQPVPLEDGVLAVLLPDYTIQPQASAAVSALRASNILPEGYVVPAHAAVTLLESVKDQAIRDKATIPDALLKGPYKSAIGDMRFGADHELAQNPYTLFRWQDGRFVPENGSDSGD